MSKKSDIEKKNITKSIKLSSEMLRDIESKAKENSMNFSQYVLDCVVHRENSITPELLCGLENVFEGCKKLVGTCNSAEAEFIRMEMNKLWESLK